MKLAVLKNIIGFSLVGLHILAVVLCYVWLEDRMSEKDFRVTLLILAPVSSFYAMAFAKDMARHIYADQQPLDSSRAVTRAFSVLAVVFTAFFSLLVIYTIYRYRTGAILDPNTLKERLALVEAVAGGFLGLIADTLFGSAAAGLSPTRKSRSKNLPLDPQGEKARPGS